MLPRDAAGCTGRAAGSNHCQKRWLHMAACNRVRCATRGSRGCTSCCVPVGLAAALAAPHLPVDSSSLRTAVTASTTSRPKKSLSAPTILLLMAVLAAAISVSAPSAEVGMASFSCRYLQACAEGKGGGGGGHVEAAKPPVNINVAVLRGAAMLRPPAP